MTFRPSDDVLDELVSWQNNNSVSQYDVEKQEDNQIIFGNHENQSFENVNISGNLQKNGIDLNVINIESEEVKAPDLSELLKDGWNDEITQELNNVENNLQKSDDVVNTIQELNNIESTLQESSNIGDTLQENNGLKHDENISKISWDEKNKTQQEVILQQSDWLKDDEKENIGIKQVKNNNTNIQSKKLSDSDNLLDEDRMRLVSSLDWSVNSNLDYLVDKNLVGIIEKYKNIHYLFFRWWYFILAVIIGILWWVLLQVKANTPDSFEMINDSSIQNIWRWIEETSDKKLSVLSGSDIDIVALVPYGAVSIDWDLFSSKSNLIKYNWVVLPQLSFINFNSWEIVSLENFDAKTLTRNDIENLVVELITDDSNYKNTTNLPSVWDVRWIPNTFQWWLYNGFNLKCLNSNKISDFVCDKFLDNFYLYGKYYNLSEDSSEFAELIRNIKKQWKDIEPLCKMIKDYTLRSWLTSDVMFSMMENCGVNDYMYYKKLVNFIDLENSLWQPELSDKVFDDPDLNAYKLLSAQQNVYKILDGTSINESYIKSYLKYVQNLLDKDKGSNRYLHPIYKDLLYVFNVDELSQKLMKKWKLSSDLKQMIDQINNWSPLYGSVSLISQLTTSDIIKVETWIVVDTKERTLEDLFSQYYAMTDRLRIRKADFVSDTEIKVQTEMFTDNIMGATNWETLKVTIDLYRQDNLLYVNTIKVANQPNFTDILWIYALEWNITFYAMLNYIDEQVGMWYELEPEEIKEQPIIINMKIWIKNWKINLIESCLWKMILHELLHQYSIILLNLEKIT